MAVPNNQLDPKPVLTLVDFDGSRRNTFTTMRIILAWLVLYGHSFAIAKTPGVSDPLNRLFQGSMWIGELSVNSFFALSGFLVCASYVNRGFLDYAVSRGLRIFPALIISVIFVTMVLGAATSTLRLSDYFSELETWRYLRNALAFFRMYWYLPGVFEGNVNQAVNGSIWTLTVEVRCYALLAICGLLGVFQHRHIANFFLACLFLFSLFYFYEVPMLGVKEKWARPAGYFLLGVILYVNRDRVVLDLRLAALALLLCGSAMGKPWFDYVFAVSWVYLLFYLAYRSPYIDADKKIGDISYGVYIYAWPIQQLVVFLSPGMHPYENVIWSTLIVVPMSWLSWHYAEKPILGLKASLLKTRTRSD